MLERRFLSDEFLAGYAGKAPRNKGILFEVTYLRTYSRWLPEHKRRETWIETCIRVVEYSLGLYRGPAEHKELQAEAELMFDRMFNLEVLPAGRTLWIGGTRAAEKWGEANFNCSATEISDIEDFCDVFSLLLVGAGVGFDVRKQNTSKLPWLNPDIKVTHTSYVPVAKRQRLEFTRTDKISDVCYQIRIGDSKEGWVEALRSFLTLHTQAGIQEIVLVYDSIRPAKERLKTFGGRAAGHKGIKEMFTRIQRSIKERQGHLGSVGSMDCSNLIAQNVVVGGTRRSAQIALSDPDDIEFITAKVDMYEKREVKLIGGGTAMKWKPKREVEHRKMSNNSVSFEHHPTREQITSVFKGIKHNGDPGFFNLAAARKRQPYCKLINPCAEILLSNKGVCNLSTVVISSHVVDGVLDRERLKESFRLAARIGLRQTNVDLSLPEWDKVQKRDRLLGVSMTGFMEAMDRLEVMDRSIPAMKEYLEDWRGQANSEATRYAFEMRVPRPLLVTAVKPEGTLSLLPTVSCGMHRTYSPYFVRRISVSAMDPIAKALIDLGVPYEEDETQEETEDNEVRRLKFLFPVKTDAKEPASVEPAREQFARYLMFQKHYTDHNTSCTLTVGNDEWDEMEQLVYDNWDDVVACAFINKYEDTHPQLPYSRITQEEYERLAKDFPDLTNLSEVVNLHEGEEEFDTDLDDSCSTGACPPR